MHEGFVRLGFFGGVLSVMAMWEMCTPLRKSRISKGRRRLGNFAILILNSIIVRVLFPTAAFGVAMIVDSEGWGVFNYFSLPPWTSVVLCIVALDLTIYYQHALLHAAPVLWRVHRMHHAD